MALLASSWNHYGEIFRDQAQADAPRDPCHMARGLQVVPTVRMPTGQFETWVISVLEQRAPQPPAPPQR
jgi:hypothetical protein